MLSSKKILILLIEIFFCAICFAQGAKIDSLKKILPLLHDSARVDCLNALAEVYVGLPDWFTDRNSAAKFDTARILNRQAIEEARRVNYQYGMAKALSLQAEIVFEIDNNYPEAEKISREAIAFYDNTPNKKGLNRAYWRLGTALQAQSEFEAGTNIYQITYNLSREAGDSLYMLYSIVTTVHLSLDWGKYTRAVEKVKNLHEMILANGDSILRFWELQLIGDLYSSFEDLGTAAHYYDSANKFLKSPPTDVVDTANKRDLRFYLTDVGEKYVDQKEYGAAMPILIRSLDLNKQANDVNQVMKLLIDIARSYNDMQHRDTALRIAREALLIAKGKDARQKIRDAYKILSFIYDDGRHADSAFFYYKRYAAMNDSIFGEQVKAKLDAFNFDQQIESLARAKKIQEMRLQRQSLLKNVLIGSIIFLLLLGVAVVRNIALKRKNEKLKLRHELDLQKLDSDKQLSELEMQALRAQMNPHFIFNSLNSINRFILQNDRAQASEYLTKFSKLVRMILQNSQASLITLESELESLGLYLEMEALRFDYHFNYNISIPKDLDISLLKVPPLIIQPYVENAIWHGLMHKEEKGQLNIEILQENKNLFFKIMDDGIGRKKAAELASKSATRHKSMGLRITADRIAMIQSSEGTVSPVTINDLVNADGTAAGTEVIIKIPVIYD